MSRNPQEKPDFTQPGTHQSQGADVPDEITPEEAEKIAAAREASAAGKFYDSGLPLSNDTIVDSRGGTVMESPGKPAVRKGGVKEDEDANKRADQE